MSAVASCGLQLYAFGETVSIPFWEESWRPDSFFDKITGNLSRGLHTLCLLDIKVKEKSLTALMKGRDEFEEPRFMSASVAARQLLQIVASRSAARGSTADDKPLLNKASVVVALARLGSDDQKIVSCSLQHLADLDMGPPLHCLAIPGNMHPLERDMLSLFQVPS